MTLFVVAFLVIAGLVLLLWLFVRPLDDELRHLSGRSVALHLRRRRPGRITP
jgi:hypothetical protein